MGCYNKLIETLFNSAELKRVGTLGDIPENSFFVCRLNYSLKSDSKKYTGVVLKHCIEEGYAKILWIYDEPPFIRKSQLNYSDILDLLAIFRIS